LLLFNWVEKQQILTGKNGKALTVVVIGHCHSNTAKIVKGRGLIRLAFSHVGVSDDLG
jgi:hypothetical protein